MKRTIKKISAAFAVLLCVLTCALSFSSCSPQSGLQYKSMVCEQSQMTLTFKVNKAGSYRVRGAYRIIIDDENFECEKFNISIEADASSTYVVKSISMYESEYKKVELIGVYVLENSTKFQNYSGVAIGLGVASGVLLAGLTALFVVQTVKRKKK